MAAPISRLSHHVKSEFCTTRPKYREGRQLKAVKVYTINDESKYLIVQGIPAVGTQDELLKLFSLNGDLADHKAMKEYPSEDFCETLLVKFKDIQSARHAKRKLDDTNFYGGVLHICYAPEFESVQETREKLQDRRRSIAWRKRKLVAEKKQLEEAAGIATSEIDEDNTVEPEKNQEDETYSNPQSEQSNSGSFHRFIHDPVQGFPPGPAATYYGSQLDYHSHPRYIPNQYHNFHGAVLPPRLPDFAPSEGIPENGHLQNQETKVVRPKANKEMSKVNGDVTNETNDVGKDLVVNKNFNVAKAKDPVVKKNYSQKPAAGKLIPRQVTKRKVLPEGLLGKVTQTTKDSVNEELRKKAFILGEVKGPSRTEFDEEAFRQASATGDKNMDNTVLQIRQKVQEFSAIARPPQLKRKKMSTKNN